MQKAQVLPCRGILSCSTHRITALVWAAAFLQQQQGCNTAGAPWKPLWFTGVAAHSTGSCPSSSSENSPFLFTPLGQSPCSTAGFWNIGGWGCAKPAPGLGGSAGAGLPTQQDSSLQASSSLSRSKCWLYPAQSLRRRMQASILKPLPCGLHFCKENFYIALPDQILKRYLNFQWAKFARELQSRDSMEMEVSHWWQADFLKHWSMFVHEEENLTSKHRDSSESNQGTCNGPVL